MKTLEKDPANRFPTIQAFTLALEDALVSHIPATIPAKPVTPTPPAQETFPGSAGQSVAPGPLITVPLFPHPFPPQSSPANNPSNARLAYYTTASPSNASSAGKLSR